jgi:hypothetical protein
MEPTSSTEPTEPTEGVEPTAATTDDATESQLDLRVTDDRLSVLLSCPSGECDESDLIGEIEAELETMNIKSPLDLDALKSGLDEAREAGEDIVDLAIATGKPPVPPQDGKLDWTGDFFTKGYYVDPETKQIDYRRMAAAPDVKKEQLLVVVTPHELGEDGRDVQGRTIRAEAPKRVQLRGGPNVVWNDDDSGYRSVVDGRVKLSGSTVDVSETMHISGDVGTKSGNVVHKGDVAVSGDVVSQFGIDAKGDIEVKGVIGACDIDTRGTLTVKGGIRGAADKLVKAKEGVNSKYIEGAVVESEGDVVVELNIVQSVIHTCGSVNVKGRIVGGTVIAAKGITVGQAGSKELTETVLVAGVDYRVLESVKHIGKLKDETKKVLRNLVLEKRRIEVSSPKLCADQKETLTEMMFEVEDVKERADKLEEEDKELHKLIYANKGAEIEISGDAYPGAILRVLDSQFEVTEALKGPFVAAIDSVTGELGLSSITEEDTE